MSGYFPPLAAFAPLAFWFQGIGDSIQETLEDTADVNIIANLTIANVSLVILILVATWAVIRYAAHLLRMLGDRSPRARFAIRWLEPLLRITMWFVAVFFSLELLAPSQETFIAGLSSVAIAIGLGAQDLIKNFVGGLVVLADRPYQLGDSVKIGDAYGEIDHIGLRSTKLTTPDDTRVTIPNADVLTKEVYNANSGVPDCQVVTDLFLPADVDTRQAVEVCYEAAYTCPYLHLGRPVVVLVTSLFQERPYVRLRVKSYVHDHRHEPRMMSDITARAQEEFRRLGMLAGWHQPSVRDAFHGDPGEDTGKELQ